MNKLLCLLLIISLMCSHINGQRDLKREESDATSILESISTSPNKMERASVTKEDERSVTVSLRFAGFEDKEYRIQVSILDQRKNPMAEITPVETDMPRSRQTDVTLFLTDSGKPLTTAYLSSKYLRIRVAPKEAGVAGVLDEFLEGLNPSATEYLYELDKRWMTMGAGIKLNATLVPYKNAAAISPN